LGPGGPGPGQPPAHEQAHQAAEGGRHGRPEDVTGAALHGEQARMLSEDRSEDFGSRWDAVQTTFVDDPRRAVEQADGLVGDVLDEISRVFREQRADLEQRWADDSESTENLRVALQRYREFFHRLLTI
jgi:hypothetical protein